MTPAPAICEGATGVRVRWARYLLAGLTLSYNQIDGIVGPVAKTAAGQFQRDSYLTVDGVPGRRMSRPPGRLMPADPAAAAVRSRRRHRALAPPPPCAPAAATVLPRTPDHQEEPR